MKWGDIYRTGEKVPERGYKPGFYVVVSRDFIAHSEDISTIICAPIYSEILGLRSEVLVSTEDGLPQDSAIRCDFLMLMFKAKLRSFISTLSAGRQIELRSALRYALQLDK